MKVYTDGSCKNGIGGWAWWNETTDQEMFGTETFSTNQRMELKAALEAINEFYTDPELVIISDSAYLVNCFGERWWAKWIQNGWVGTRGNEIINRDIWEPLLDLVEQHGNITFVWVKGHSGNRGNEKVDKLAQKAVEDLVKGSKRHVKPADEETGTDEAGEGTGVSSSDRADAGLPSDGVAEADHSGDPS